VRVGIAVRDQRGGGAAVAVDLQRRLESEPLRREHANELIREREVARTPSVARAAERVDAANCRGVEADAGREAEPSARDASERDPSRALREARVHDSLR